MSHEVDAVTVDARHGGVEVATQVKALDGLTVDIGSGNDDTARLELLFIGRPVEVDALSDEGGDGVDVDRSDDNQQAVVGMKYGLTVDHLVVFTLAARDDAGDDEVALGDILELFDRHAVNTLVGHLEGKRAHGELFQLTESSLGGTLLVGRFDAKDITQQDEGKNDADDTQRISQRITRGNVGSLNAFQSEISLLGSAHTRRIGHGTGEDTNQGGDGHVGNIIDADDHQDTDGAGHQNEHVELETSFLERGEETGTYLQTNAVDEQHQTKLTQEVKQLDVEVETEITKHHADDQHPHQLQ